MSLDPHLWQALEEHGVTAAHLDMLLTVLQLQRNGSWTWHVVNGQVEQCDVRVTIPARSREVGRVAGVIGQSLPRGRRQRA